MEYLHKFQMKQQIARSLEHIANKQ